MARAVVGPTAAILARIAGGNRCPGTRSRTEATAVGLIREVPGTVGRYAFAHALVRSALYEELTSAWVTVVGRLPEG